MKRFFLLRDEMILKNFHPVRPNWTLHSSNIVLKKYNFLTHLSARLTLQNVILFHLPYHSFIIIKFIIVFCTLTMKQYISFSPWIKTKLINKNFIILSTQRLETNNYIKMVILFLKKKNFYKKCLFHGIRWDLFKIFLSKGMGYFSKMFHPTRRDDPENFLSCPIPSDVFQKSSIPLNWWDGMGWDRMWWDCPMPRRALFCYIKQNFKVFLKMLLQSGVTKIRKYQNNQLRNGTYHMNIN